MINTRRIFSLSLLGFLIVLLPVNAQVTDCSMNYEKALLEYNRGMANSVLDILKPCLENKRALAGLSKETCARIFRLASLSSIMTGNPEEAEKYASKLLINQPDYKNFQHEGDLMEFRMILDRISATPSLMAGIYFGTNFPFTTLQKEYSNYELESPESGITGKTGYVFGITGELALTRSISLEAGAGINQILFEYTRSGRDMFSQMVENKYDIKFSWIEIPVLMKYYVLHGSFKPYLEAGITGKFSLYTREKSDLYGKYWLTQSSNSDRILTTFLTDFEKFGLVGGAGLRYDMKKISLMLDVRYNLNLRNSGVSSNFDSVSGYEDIGTSEKFYYTDDLNLISLQQLQISIGVMYKLKYRVF